MFDTAIWIEMYRCECSTWYIYVFSGTALTARQNMHVQRYVLF